MISVTRIKLNNFIYIVLDILSPAMISNEITSMIQAYADLDVCALAGREY